VTGASFTALASWPDLFRPATPAGDPRFFGLCEALRLRRRAYAGDALDARSVSTLVRPVPAQALQMILSPRSRMRPVPKHCTQVSWRTGAGRLLCFEKRLPKSTG
jgi:hypothetical protein